MGARLVTNIFFAAAEEATSDAMHSMTALSGTTSGKLSSTTTVAKPLAALSAALPAECCWLHTRTGDGELKLGAHNRFVESGRFGASLHVAACSSRAPIDGLMGWGGY